MRLANSLPGLTPRRDLTYDPRTTSRCWHRSAISATSMGDLPMQSYVHGYSDREARRLQDQANAVENLIHHDTVYPTGALVLEVACGVGAQTVTIARQSPETRFISFDVSIGSLAAAVNLVRERELSTVRLLAADLFALPFQEQSFDHVFVSFVLEHMHDPLRTLQVLSRMLRPNGTMTVIEGDHGSCYFFPTTDAARRAWNCLIQVQEQLGGDSLIGRRLYPLLCRAGYCGVTVSPRMVYADQSNPDLMEGFVGKTIVPMVQGVEQEAITRRLIDPPTWEQGLADLRAVESARDGTFCYTFFKAVGRKPA
jgi:SAM-dependent methyltransferase